MTPPEAAARLPPRGAAPAAGRSPIRGANLELVGRLVLQMVGSVWPGERK
jgi:hypothetical protein